MRYICINNPVVKSRDIFPMNRLKRLSFKDQGDWYYLRLEVNDALFEWYCRPEKIEGLLRTLMDESVKFWDIELKLNKLP